MVTLLDGVSHKSVVISEYVFEDTVSWTFLRTEIVCCWLVSLVVQINTILETTSRISN